MTYTLTVAPWAPPQVCAHPEMSGPMSAAWREAAPAIARRTRWAHLVTLVAERNAARHLSTYPRAYVAPIGERTGSAPAVLTGALVGSLDRDFREAHAIERIANYWLARGCECTTESDDRCEQCQSIGAPVDVLVRGHLEIRPDRAAYRGVTRVKPRRCHRSNVARTVRVWTAIPADDETYVFQLDAPVIRYTMHAVTIRGKRTLIGAPGMVNSLGRRINVIARTPQVAHKARKARAMATRTPGETSTRGRSVSPWSMSARSLPRRWDGVVKDGVRTGGATSGERALAALWASVLTTTASDGRYVTVGTISVKRDGPARVILNHGPQTPIGIIEASRRLALAGEMPD